MQVNIIHVVLWLSAALPCPCLLSLKRLWLSPLGGVPKSQFPPQEQAEGAGALPPREDESRGAGQHGRRPLHLRRPGGL